MSPWQAVAWTVVLLGPPALFGTAVAWESWWAHWAARSDQPAEPLSVLDRLDGLRRHPSSRDVVGPL